MHSWDPDTRTYYQFAQSAFSEKSTNRVSYEGHIGKRLLSCMYWHLSCVYINGVEIYPNEGWTLVLISTRRKGWLEVVDVR